MKRTILTTLFIMGIASFFYGFLYRSKPLVATEIKNFHDFKVKDIDGKELNFASFKGKKVLVVNVASECGYTPQYEGLEQLYKKYSDKLVIIGFPCNQFGGQEPGTHEEIKKFCTSKYNVTFLLTEKVEVKGEHQHPVYQWLTQKALNGVEDTEVKWNFNKYLIDEKGNYLKRFGSKVEPMSAEITSLL